MPSNLDQKQSEFVFQFEDWLKIYLLESASLKNSSGLLHDSQNYSLSSGGKRFRPFLAALVFRLFSQDIQKLKNFCLALEMIHTYSLIHDDLPCMDNDDFRRGKPSNHRVFSEDISLLAGDGLLTDAFFLIADDKLLKGEAKVEMISLLSKKAGSSGMVAGQAMDMKADKNLSFENLKAIHELKTANLIQAAAVGAGIAAGCSDTELHNISEFSYHLGMAFQIKDDLLDFNDNAQDFKSYLNFLGAADTLLELEKHSDSAVRAINLLGKNSVSLVELVEFNLKRNS